MTVLAVDLGGTKLLVALVNEHRVLNRIEAPTNRDAGPDAWLAQIADMAAPWSGEYNRIGVTVTGLVQDGIQPEPTLLGLFLRDFQPLPPPDSLYALVIYMPAAVVQHPRRHCRSDQWRNNDVHAISVTPKLSCQLNDVLGQPLLVRENNGHVALRGGVLSQGAANPALGYAAGLPDMIGTAAAAGRA